MYEDDTLRCGFRLRLSKEQTERLQLVSPQEVTLREQEGESVVASLWLDPQADYMWLNEFVRAEKLVPSSHDFFISLASAHDTNIIEVPPHVLALARRIETATVYFSYTVL